MDHSRTAKKILYLPEIAAKTGVPLDTLRWWRHRGEGPKMFRLGRRVVAYEADVDAWIDECAAVEYPEPAA